MKTNVVCQLLSFFLSIFWSVNIGSSKLNFQPNESWTGRWFPERPQPRRVESSLFDNKHGVKMGVSVDSCDNGMVNLTIDWDYSPSDYTCFDQRQKYATNYIQPVLECDHIPVGYSALHECMDTKIEYTTMIPTFGTHRPLWPKYGEYKYLPPQRWLHNLEHGAVVMLYHPCAPRQEVELLKSLVKGCLYRHVITPSNRLSEDRPLALVVWGCRLTMSKVYPKVVHSFIIAKALSGPEDITKDGQFSQQLLNPAKVVTTIADSTLCPLYN